MASREPDPADVMREVREAGEQWAGAMRAHKLAPPDPAFAGRIRQLADAAARERVAWEQAHAAGLMWRPVPGAETAQPPYELRPGTGRRGPDELWSRFDQAVADLNRAITGSNAAAVARAFGELSSAALTLAGAIERQDRAAATQDRAAATEDRATATEPPAAAHEHRAVTDEPRAAADEPHAALGEPRPRARGAA